MAQGIEIGPSMEESWVRTLRVNGSIPIWWVLAAVPVGFCVLLATTGDPGPDSSAFIYVADGLLRGELPYLDRWDHKGPLAYIVDATGRLISPDSAAGIQAIGWLSLIVSAALGFVALQLALGGRPATIAIIVAGMALAALAQPGNYTEQWALLPQLAALFLFVRIGARSTGCWREVGAALLIGCTGAAAFLLRPNLVGLWLAIGFVWVTYKGAGIRHLLAASIGGAGTLALAILLLATIGAFEAYIDAVFRYNEMYTGGLEPSAWLARASNVLTSSPIVAVAALAWAVAVALARRLHDARSREAMLVRWAAIAGPLELLLLAVTDRAYVHYHMALIPLLAVLTALVVAPATRTDWRVGGYRLRPAEWRLPVGNSLTITWFSLLTLALSHSVFASMAPANNDALRLAASMARGATADNETILVWGNQAQIYLLSGRQAPTRFFYQLPLVTLGYTTEALVDAFVSELALAPPALIIDTRHQEIPPIDASARSTFVAARREYRVDSSLLGPFFKFVEEGYTRGDDLAGWPMYWRHD